MPSVGERLRAARESQGRSLQQLAQETRISSRFLLAIENDDPSPLPGGFFYKSFVLQYAAALGLDGDDLRAALDRDRPAASMAVVPPEPPPRLGTDRGSAGLLPPDAEPLPSRTAFRIGLLVVMVVGCTALVAMWDQSRRTDAPAPAAPAENAAPVTKADPEPGSTTPPESARETPGEGGTTSAAPDTEPGAAGAVAGAATPAAGRYAVTVTARVPTWCSMTADGKSVFVGLLAAEETRTFLGAESARLRVGNAAGVDVSWNGKAIGAVGPSGQVRTVVFTPERYDVVAAERQQASP